VSVLLWDLSLNDLSDCWHHFFHTPSASTAAHLSNTLLTDVFIVVVVRVGVSLGFDRVVGVAGSSELSLDDSSDCSYQFLQMPTIGNTSCCWRCGAGQDQTKGVYEQWEYANKGNMELEIARTALCVCGFLVFNILLQPSTLSSLKLPLNNNLCRV